jgi:glycosyltransferase involved in cell wall biosynthesis
MTATGVQRGAAPASPQGPGRCRVLHLAAGNLFGGIETLLVTLARHRSLAPEVEPEFALCFEGRLSEALRAQGVKVHLLGAARFSRPWTIWSVRRRLRRVLAAGGFDVAVSHGCWPHALAAPVVRRSALPLVFWAHGIQAGRHWLERWAARHRPDGLLANSRVTQASLRNLFPGLRGEVVYYPVSPPSLADRAGARREVRAELGTPEDALVILTACRLEPWKGHVVLVEALGQMAALPEWECWVAGGAQRAEEESYLAGLHRQAERLGVGGRVRFLGQRSDVPRLLAAADIHCQPNTGPEPFGIAFIEALYAGLPVVTSALGGAEEIVRADCGVLVPPGDAAALAEALRQLLRDPAARARLTAGGPARGAALCDPAAQMTRLEQLLQGARHGGH